MSLRTALEELQQDERFRRRVTAWHEEPPQPARYAPWPDALHPRARAVIEAQGIRDLYTHQSQALTHLLRGEHTMVVTATASGKSLIYHLATLHTLLSDPTARVIYLFPTKALAQDQYRHLARLLRAVGGERWVGVYDGDTPPAERARIRKQARVLITNPDMLHMGLLPYHPRWSTFWQGLQYIVVDETHTYRGIFGAHVANVFRRLRRVARFYGADPRW
ncbi:MAG: DEAD/DEAH box helicase, partial [Chloroflexi bacterium]|nr:DEAD/DEAH box helicase [Chloroflexota bacterium]